MPLDDQTAAHPWVGYNVGELSGNPKQIEPTCQSFESISHVTHIESAISILKNGTILPQLVYDTSILNEDRILVNWLSPNWWNDGFRYGNVRFEFDFAKLIDKKNLYWVEVMKEYNPHALRILITSQDRSSDKRLTKYDPSSRSGPWWYDPKSGKHYRNGRYTLEFMLERELNVTEAKEISFERHHKDYCCVDKVKCPDKNLGADRAAGYFAAGIALHDVDCSGFNFSASAYGEMVRSFLRVYGRSEKSSYSSLSLDNEAMSSLARAWMGAFYFRRVKEQESITALMPSRDAFFEAIVAQLLKCFDPEKLATLQDPANAEY